MKKLIAVAAMLFATSAYAQSPPPKPVMVELSPAEVEVTIQMIDVCVKAQGLGCSEPANGIVKKLREAAEKANPSKPK